MIGIERFGISNKKKKAEAGNNHAQTLSHNRSHKGASPQGRTGKSSVWVNVEGYYNLVNSEGLARMSWAKLIKRKRAQQGI
jgi:hypothetical protein